MTEELSERIRRFRKARGLTQGELAGSEYSTAYISTIEAGRRVPSPKALGYLARRLLVEPEELLTGRSKRLEAELLARVHEARTLIFDGRSEQARKALSEHAVTASKTGLRRLEARAIECLALIEERANSPEAAALLYERAVELLEDAPLPLSTEAVAGLARCRQMQGQLRLAIHLLDTHLLCLRRSGLEDPSALMRVQASLVWPLTEAGLLDQASEAAAGALRLEPLVRDPEQIASMHLNVARELLRQGSDEDALDSLKRAEDLYRSLEWRAELARAHGNKAIVLAEKGDLGGARRENLAALKLASESNNRLAQARALNELGRVERLSHNHQAAKDALARAIDLLGDADVLELALSYRELGLCSKGERNLEEAETSLRRAIGLYRRGGATLETAITYRLLGDVLCALGNGEGGREAFREGLMTLEEATAA